MTWFLNLTGLGKESKEEVFEKLKLDKNNNLQMADGQRYACGSFETISLAELRQRVSQMVKDDLDAASRNRLRIEQIVGDVASLHQDPKNHHAVFQVASQFNCLEMASPAVTPEDGIGIYQNDFTQGPACSIAAGAGTIFRNYFVPLGNQIGQTETLQVDCLKDLKSQFCSELGLKSDELWEMRNGYCFPSSSGLDQITRFLSVANEEQWQSLQSTIQVGVQADTQVTITDEIQRVTQVFCSALPVAYSRLRTTDFNLFARLILLAAYESTFLTAIENKYKTGNNRLFLTLIGGGVFGNKMDWIIDAIEVSVEKYRQFDLDIKIVSYGGRNPIVDNFLSGL